MTDSMLNRIAEKLAPCIKKRMEECKANYKWHLPEPRCDGCCSELKAINEFAKDKSREGKDAAQLIAFRQKFAEVWNSGVSQTIKERLATYVIADWGGIRSNSPKTIERYVRQSTDYKSLTKSMVGMASKSKILAAVDPVNCFVYDSWVCYGLNRFIENNIEKPDFYFPRIIGRNKKIKEYRVKSVRTKKRLCYQDYCDLIKRIAEMIQKEDELQLIEMTIFYMSRKGMFEDKCGAKGDCNE